MSAKVTGGRAREAVNVSYYRYLVAILRGLALPVQPNAEPGTTTGGDTAAIRASWQRSSGLKSATATLT